jgi:hypothetical protein
MKKQILTILLLSVFTLISHAQKIELTPFAGYTFADKIPIELGEAKIYGGFTWGGIFAVKIAKYSFLELNYTRVDAKATAYSDLPGFIDVEDKVSVNYILAGINKTFPVLKKGVVFVGINLGSCILASKTDKFTTMTKFSIGISSGIKYPINKKLALRVQAFLNTPVTDEGETIWWSSGNGVTAGSTSYFPLTQFGLTGGAVINLK